MLIDKNFTQKNIKLYDKKGNLMNFSKSITSYCKLNNPIWKFKVSLYNVITMTICYKTTKLITFTNELKRVADLR